MKKYKELIIAILIPLAVGGLAALLTAPAMGIYSKIVLPPLAPPSILFPIVWTILYVLMGISSYRIYKSCCAGRENALTVYAVSLIVNFLWPVLFFLAEAYVVAFICIILLDASVILTLWYYKKCDNVAFYLQIPYLVWVLFATYLNLAIAILN